MLTLLGPWTVPACGLGLVLLASFLFLRYIPNDRVGIVEKLFSANGSVPGGLIALHAESGFQPEVLRGGWHVLFRLQHRIHRMPLVTIPQGKIGYLFARDGRPLLAGQALASSESARDVEDVRAFLEKGGQKGPQRMILREGTYALNLVQFVVLTESTPLYLPLDGQEAESFKRMAELVAERQGFQPIVIKGADDTLGVVTVHDGPSLAQGEIIAPTVGDDPHHEATFHDGFQDPERFLRAGGFRGRQLQVLVEGTYYVNRLFATVEMIPKTVIEVGNAGVVVSYVGEAGIDVSGAKYKHGELVVEGTRGVWETPLLPGKYAFNTYAGKVVIVPTTNIILKWLRSETGSHKLDENLSEIDLITKDAFEPSLPLSVVLHIDYKKAPLVIQRFGDIRRLVEQTLDPMVSAYFKNVGQTRTLIQLIQDRSAIQALAGEQMKEKFTHYNLELEEVLIGTPASGTDAQIEKILTQLRSRQIAEEQVETYATQERAAVKERELREAESRARQQSAMTESEISITVQSNQGKAEYQRSIQQAAQIQALAEAEGRKVRILAEAEGERIKAIGEADADRAARVGVAQAIAIDEQVRAYGGPRLQALQQVMSRFAQAIETARIDVVPRILVSGGKDGDGGAAGSGFLQALLGILLSEKLGDPVTREAGPRGPEADALMRQLRQGLVDRPLDV